MCFFSKRKKVINAVCLLWFIPASLYLWKFWIYISLLNWLNLFAEKENLCLYGLPNETWEVNLPVEEVPPELPEPALGINFARDGMQEKDWLSLVAVHSDSWLLAVAFYFGARFGFGKNERYVCFFFVNYGTLSRSLHARLLQYHGFILNLVLTALFCVHLLI